MHLVQQLPNLLSPPVKKKVSAESKWERDVPIFFLQIHISATINLSKNYFIYRSKSDKQSSSSMLLHLEHKPKFVENFDLHLESTKHKHLMVLPWVFALMVWSKIDQKQKPNTVYNTV